MMMENSESKKTSQNNQKQMMKISSSKNGGIASVILLGGALITAALGSAFLVERNRRKSSKKITKNEKNKDDESTKGLHFLVPDSSPFIEQQLLSSNGTEMLGANDLTSLFSTPCLIQDVKPKIEMVDENRDTLNALVFDYSKEEEKPPSFGRLPVHKEEFELSENKILLPDPNQDLNEVSEVIIEVVQESEKTEEAHGHQVQATIFYNPSLQVDDKSEFLVDEKHNVEGALGDLQRTDMIEIDNYDEGLIQDQEKQPTVDQEIINPDDSSPESSTSSEQEFFGQGDQPNVVIELMKADYEDDEDKGSMQIMHFEERCAGAETQNDQTAEECNLHVQFNDEQKCSKENNQANSFLGNSSRRTYSMVVQNLVASAIRNASTDDRHYAEVIQVIKETNVMDIATGGDQSLEAEYSPILLVEKQSFEPDCQGNCLVLEKDLEAHNREAEDEVAESVLVHAEKEDDDYDNVIDKDDAAEEVEDSILDGDQDVEMIEVMKAADENEDKGHMQIMYFQEQFADGDIPTDQIAKKCNLQMQVIAEQESSKENEQANSCYEEAITENSPCRTYSMVVQKLAASAMKNASLDDQHSAEVIQVIKETNASDQHSAEVIQDTAATGEQSLEAEHSPIQLVEKQTFEPDRRGNGLGEDKEASGTLGIGIEVMDKVHKDLEEHSRKSEDEVAEGAFEEEEDDDNDYDNIDKDGASEEIDDETSEGAGNSSEQSNYDRIWLTDSNQELLLVLKEKNTEEEEEGMKIRRDEACSLENCDLKSTQNDLNITSCQQSYDSKDDTPVNVIERYRTKLMYLDDVPAITMRGRMLFGALLLLIWYFCLKAFSLPALLD